MLLQRPKAGKSRRFLQFPGYILIVGPDREQPNNSITARQYYSPQKAPSTARLFSQGPRQYCGCSNSTLGESERDWESSHYREAGQTNDVGLSSSQNLRGTTGEVGQSEPRL